MVAKQRTLLSPEPARGLSPKQLSIFASVRRFIREQGQAPTIRQLRQAHDDMSRGSFAHNLDVLQTLGYLRRSDDHDAVRLELGKRAIKEARLWELVDEGFLKWSGGRPRGSRSPVEITPGPPVSDYVIEDRG